MIFLFTLWTFITFFLKKSSSLRQQMSCSHIISPITTFTINFHSSYIHSPATRTPMFFLKPSSNTLSMKPMFTNQLGWSSILQTNCTSLWTHFHSILLSSIRWPFYQPVFIIVDLFFFFPLHFCYLITHHWVLMFYRLSFTSYLATLYAH